MLTRFSDFIMGFILACLVITLGRLALAHTVDDEVNAHIKEEFIKMDIAQKRAVMAIPEAQRINSLQDDNWSRGEGALTGFDENLNHSDDLTGNEQSQLLERPRAGVRRMADPLDSIEEKIVQDQAYKLYREHYRGAAKKELISRAHALGLEPTNAVADELTARMIDGQALPYPSTATQRN